MGQHRCTAPAFDFGHWSRLARQDLPEFERQRQQAIDDLIDRLPENRRLPLRRLQWRIDQVRRRAATPMAACLALSRMMWDSVLAQDGLLHTLQGSAPARPGPGARRATILPFRR
ncbi:MAG: DUF3135 domain-containing protein [Gammaproteobacteria bacterium]